MDLQLDGRLALVTASTKGIGFAIARSLAREGARVIVNGRTAASVEEARRRLHDEAPHAHTDAFAGDLGTAADADRLVAQFPDVEILVNNLGIFEPKPFEQISDADWLRFFEVNVMSGVRLSRAYVGRMKARNWGRIVFISSESGIQIPVEMIHYGTTKTAQLAISRGLAESCAGTGVTVNAVLPGPTASEGVVDFVREVSGGQSFEAFQDEFFRSVRPSSLLKRFETPDEIAHLVTFVCSPLASGITGAALRVDGGVVRAAS
jgi:NAD(P)-dependent dehydrogenase (short-subunit alcohol dehydrogenase family)